MDNELKRKGETESPQRRKRSTTGTPNAGVIVSSVIVPYELNGLARANQYIRIIKPYIYNFQTNAKARWIGRTVLDVYGTEFPSYPPSYYESAIENGTVQVCGKSVTKDYAIGRGDLLQHLVHRHEPAVALFKNEAPFVDVVAETEYIVAVNKPPTLPLHPCGGYHENSLINILKMSYDNLLTIHRLDRLTSGLVLFARDKETAKTWSESIQSGDCEKYYLARVKGKFPERMKSSSLPSLSRIEPPTSNMMNASRKKYPDFEAFRRSFFFGYWTTKFPTEAVDIVKMFDQEKSCLKEKDTPWYHVCCPVRVAQHKDGICESGQFLDLDEDTFSSTVRSACTSFILLQYDQQSDTSLVLCKPLTGRTHQIRLHLQSCGHPIANDPNYGGDRFFGDPTGKAIMEKAENVLRDMDQRVGRRVHDCSGQHISASGDPSTCEEIKKACSYPREEGETVEDFVRRSCVWCSRQCGDQDRSKLELLVRSSGIWLHALRYSRKSLTRGVISFTSPIPHWAKF